VRSYPILVLITAIIMGCSDAPVIEEEPTGRIVLAEFFTFARCGYCPQAEHALDSLFNEYNDSLAVIAYHRRVAGDTLSPVYVAVRESIYSITTSPIVVFDGVHAVQTQDTSENYLTFKNWIIHERNIAPSLRIGLETNIVSSSVNCNISLITVDSIEPGDYRLFIVLYEDSVYFPQAGAAESTFHYVIRKMLPDEYGIPCDIGYPDSLHKEVTFSLQTQWDLQKLGIVAFVQEMETKEVLQAVLKQTLVTSSYKSENN
jgi:hypothetical protein